MPAVFVHGVADTSRMWDEVRGRLRRKDTVALDLPGFGSAVPEGFGSTKEEYVAWLVRALEGMGEPVDLVGHDWGCLLVARVASVRPELVRTWAAGDGPVSASYAWHPLAKIWQTPVVGETFMVTLTEDRVTEQMMQHGVPEALARREAQRVDGRMKESILRLYRSAVTVGAEWQPGLAALRSAVPSAGLVFWGERDEACPVRFGEELARDTGARLERMESGHWVPLERPEALARVLEEHWAGRQAGG